MIYIPGPPPVYVAPLTLIITRATAVKKAMMKSVTNSALQKLLSTNKLDIKVQGWVQREVFMGEEEVKS